jgi:hypothetical protein
MANEIISRQEAKEKCLKRYFTGLLCKHGHIAERITANGCCLICSKDIETRHRQNNPEKFREKWRNYERVASPHRIAQKSRANKKYAAANRGKIDKRINQWKKDNPERVAAYGKKWRDANPGKVKEKNRKYKTKHAARLKPIALKRTKQWRKDNPEKLLENARKAAHTRRARQYKAGGAYTNKQILDLLEKQNWTCIYCPTSLKEKRELDHIMPLARNGSNNISNLQWLCLPCNREKRDRDPVEFAASILVTKNRPSLC